MKERNKQKLEERIEMILNKSVEDITNEEFEELKNKLNIIDFEENQEETQKDMIELIYDSFDCRKRQAEYCWIVK